MEGAQAQPPAASVGGIEFAIADIGEDALAAPSGVEDEGIEGVEYVEPPTAGAEHYQYAPQPAPGAHAPAPGGHPRAPRLRGLALKELTLHHGGEGRGTRLMHWIFHQKNTADLFFVSTAIDGSGDPPFVWPINQATANFATIRVEEGDTYKWTLGYGAPIFGPKVLEGGLAISILVSDSKEGVRHLGEVLGKVADDFKAQGDLLAVLAGLATGFTVPAALNAIGLATGVVADVLQLDKDKRIGAYVGLFPARGTWAGKLEQGGQGASITLAEVK